MSSIFLRWYIGANSFGRHVLRREIINSIYEMLTTDYLILNRDRHGANIEVLRNRKTKTVRLAPLFDHGLSFVCHCMNKAELKAFDVTGDKRVQSFVGGNSARDNLDLVPPDFLRSLPDLCFADIMRLTDGLEAALDRSYLETITVMIQKRWMTIEDIRSSR